MTLNKLTVPVDGESCERNRFSEEEADDDESDRELDESDSGFFNRVGGASDRLRIFALPRSAESHVPCSNGTYCSEEGECRPIIG